MRLEALRLRLDLGPLDVVLRARAIARRWHVRSIARTQFYRQRHGLMRATEPTIKLLVAAFSELSGLLLQPSDLFDFDPWHSGGFRRLYLAAAAPGGPLFGYPLCSPLQPILAWRVPLDRTRSAVETLEILYREHAPLLRGIAASRYRVPVADVDDLVDDIFASFLERQPKVDDARAFLVGAIRNACMHYWRKRQHEAPLLEEHEDTADSKTQEGLEQWMVNECVVESLAQLGPRCRETLERYYLSEQKPDAMAKEMSTTPAYVSKLIKTCRKRVRELYEKLVRPMR